MLTRNDVIVMQGKDQRHVIRKSDRALVGALDRLVSNEGYVIWDIYIGRNADLKSRDDFIGYDASMSDAIERLLHHSDLRKSV